MTTMSALLLRMSAIPDEVIYGTTSPPLSAHVERYEDRVITEESRLLSGRRGSGVSYASAKSLRKSSRSAGVLAFAGGLGAVVAGEAPSPVQTGIVTTDPVPASQCLAFSGCPSCCRASTGAPNRTRPPLCGSDSARPLTSSRWSRSCKPSSSRGHSHPVSKARICRSNRRTPRHRPCPPRSGRRGANSSKGSGSRRRTAILRSALRRALRVGRRRR